MLQSKQVKKNKPKKVYAGLNGSARARARTNRPKLHSISCFEEHKVLTDHIIAVRYTARCAGTWTLLPREMWSSGIRSGYNEPRSRELGNGISVDPHVPELEVDLIEGMAVGTWYLISTVFFIHLSNDFGTSQGFRVFCFFWGLTGWRRRSSLFPTRTDRDPLATRALWSLSSVQQFDLG